MKLTVMSAWVEELEKAQKEIDAACSRYLKLHECFAAQLYELKMSLEVRNWRTGEIPEPTEQSLLIVEAHNKDHYAYPCMTPAAGWEKTYLSGWREPNKLLAEKGVCGATGRWCIIPITLPVASGTGTN